MKKFNNIYLKYIPLLISPVIISFFIHLYKCIPTQITFSYSFSSYYLCIFFILFYCILIFIRYKRNYNKLKYYYYSNFLLFRPLLKVINLIIIILPEILIFIDIYIKKIFQTFFLYTRPRIGFYIHNFTNLYSTNNYDNNVNILIKYIIIERLFKIITEACIRYS